MSATSAAPSTVIPTHVVPLQAVVEAFVPGSFDPPWTWDDERTWLDQQVCPHYNFHGGYQRHLEVFLRARGQIEQPICLGDDGRVWDGHHRIVAALRLGFDWIPVECFCDTDSPCPGLSLVPPIVWPGDQA